MIDIEVPKEVTFDIPEGRYKVRISGIKPIVRQTGKGCQDWVRLQFGVSVPGLEHLDCRAGRNFLLTFKQGSELRNFLTPLFGAGFFKHNSSKHVDLEALLVGREGWAELVHYQGAGYEKPLIIVDRIEPVEEEV